MPHQQFNLSEILGQNEKKLVVKKDVGYKKCWVRKQFLVQKHLGSKKILSLKNIFWLKTFFFRNKKKIDKF